MQVYIPIATVDNLWPPDGLEPGKRATLRLTLHDPAAAAPVGSAEFKIADPAIYEKVRAGFRGSFIPRSVRLEVAPRVWSGEGGNVTVLNVQDVDISDYKPPASAK